MSSVEAYADEAPLEFPYLSTAGGSTYRQLLDSLPAAVYATDALGHITYFNRAAAELAGREPALGIDKWCVSARLYEADGTPLPLEECPMAVAIRERRPVRGVEVIAERPDGVRVPLMPYPTPIFDRSGRLTGALNLLVDISDLLKASAEANAAQQRLGLIVESSEDAIVSKDLDGVIVSWNAGARKLFGYTAEEAVGRPVTMLIPEDHLDEEPSILARVRRGEPIEHYDTVRRRKDGTLVDISLTVSPLKDAEGKIVGASKIARDISDRKRAASALSKRIDEQATLYQFTNRLHRAQSLADVYDSAFDAISRGLGCERVSILLFDEDNVMRFVASRGISEEYRAAVEGHTPWTPDVRDPQPVYVLDAENSDLSDELKATVKKEGIAATSFIPLVVKGRLVGKFMTYYSEPHQFPEEERDLALTIARQLGFSIDRMRAEESLRESERRLEQALSAGQMGAWEWNLTTGRVIWSPGLQRIHGMEPGTFGGTFEDFKRDIHPDDLDAVLTQVQEAIDSGGDYHVEYRMKHPDGSTRWLEAFGSFISDPETNSRRIAGICTDISERKDAEAQRDLLVAELSHRVKNTLATVISIARQSFSRSQNMDEAVTSFDARVRALAQTHTRLAEASWSGVPFQTMLLDEIAPFRRDDGSNIQISGPYIRLNPRAALTLGLAIHELATNAAKHGALSTKQGSVDISWNLDSENRLNINWTEKGGPPVKRPSRSGFGRLLLERALASDLRGDVHLDFQRSGLICAITFPLDDDGSPIH